MKNLILKVLFISFAFITYNSQSFSHSLNGEYKCRFNTWSPFKTTVQVKNFDKHYTKTGNLEYFTANVFIDGKKLEGERSRHIIKWGNKKRFTIDLLHSTAFWNQRNEGVTYNEFENKFSEKTGSKWGRTRQVFCEKVE